MLRRPINSQENERLVPSSRNGGNSACDVLEETYMEVVRPSYGQMFRILVRKHFLVSRRKWRLISLLTAQGFYVFTNFVFWHFMHGWLEGETREFLMFVLFRNITPALLVFGMKGMMDSLLAEMVGEKESKMKTVQMVYGVPPWLFWLSYLCYYLFLCAPLSALWAISLYYSCFTGANRFLVFVMFQFAFSHVFWWCALLSTLVDKLRHVNILSLLLMVIQLIPVAIGNMSLGEMPSYVQILLGFMPCMALNYWSQGVILLRLNGYEWTWDEDFFKTAVDILKFNPADLSLMELPSPGMIFMVFLAQVPAWAALAYWCDQVIQAEHGTAKPFTFFCQPRYVCPKRSPGKASLLKEVAGVANALQIHRLTKTFSRGNFCRSRATSHNAVDDMNLTVHCGEIFALLGHNGAGKTTAINCITGLVPSTSGSWEVMGLNGISDIDRCRSNLSVCPQDNPMYKELTVGEHIEFFSAVRGTKDVQKEIVEILKALGIAVKTDCKCGDLSGGQKRRLWVATALVGKAPVVFLDEPTSGMDPSSRRELWSLLLRMKGQGRTIIFTTHYLEEADTLADRKAVLSKGKVKAVGTSNELKLRFGAGYRLKILVRRCIAEAQCLEIKRLVVESVHGAVEEHFDLATQAHDAPLELRFTLPYDQVSTFSSLFFSIEAQTEMLQILDFELAMTSLEDVFMTLGKEDEKGSDGHGSMKNLEFQQLLQESQLDEVVKPTNADYARMLFWLRTRQLVGPGTVRTLILPVIILLYSLAISTAFFHNKVMVASFGLYPGVILGAAGMRFMHSLVQEREMKITHVMLSQGMPETVYWIITSLHAGIQVIIFGVIITVMVNYYGDESFTSGNNMYFIFASGCLAPVPLFLFFYFVANYFQSEESAVRFCGLMMTLASFLQLIPIQFWTIVQLKLEYVGAWLHAGFSFISPVYMMGGVMLGCWRTQHLAEQSAPELLDTSGKTAGKAALTKLLSKALVAKKANDIDILERMTEYSPLWIPFLGQFCLSIVLCIAIRRKYSYHNQNQSAVEEKTSRRDDDVLSEEERVSRSTPEAEACLFRNLHHTYFGAGKQKSVDAVQGISLGIKHGECFGLLGPNGAGKTTTLACLTGEIRPPTCGEVYIAGHNVASGNISKAYEQLGNCPQVDPLFLNLSGRLNLSFYGRLKGVPPKHLRQTVDILLQRLGIDEADRDKITQKYSGGMKRKLSLGIALIGQRNVLFLDEPTAAVDAGSKRLLWQVIKKRAAGRTVIITTHSMEEAEAICDRIAIQVLGQLRCIGTTMHLKSKYAQGYQVAIRLSKQEASGLSEEDQGKKLSEFLDSSLSTQTQLLEVYDSSFLFQLPRFEKGKLTLGRVFASLEGAKHALGIEEYTLTQASLEQVFLRFAREQAEASENEAGARRISLAPHLAESNGKRAQSAIDDGDMRKRTRLSCM